MPIRPFSQRRVAILAGLGSAVLVLLAVTVLRKEILTEYHLFRLRNHSGYLDTILKQPEGTSQRSAIHRHLETPQGRVDLLRILFSFVQQREFEKPGASRKVYTFVLEIPRPPNAWPASGFIAIFSEDSTFFEDSSRVYEVGRMPDDPIFHDLMRYLVGQSIHTGQYPGLTFICHDLESWQQYLRSKRR